MAISEPVARPEYVHEYKLTPYSLYAAVATNIDTESIVRVLNRFSKNEMPKGVAQFIRECTKRYGKAKLVLKHNKFYVESDYPAVLRELLRDELISQARVSEEVTQGEGANNGGGGDGAGANTNAAGGSNTTSTKNADGFVVNTKAEEMEENLRILREMDGDSDDDDDDGDGTPNRQAVAKTTMSFQIKGDSVETVKRRAIDLDYPLMEEYDFRNDKMNPDVPMDLKPHTKIRRYQERSLSKVRLLICVFVGYCFPFSLSIDLCIIIHTVPPSLSNKISHHLIIYIRCLETVEQDLESSFSPVVQERHSQVLLQPKPSKSQLFVYALTQYQCYNGNINSNCGQTFQMKIFAYLHQIRRMISLPRALVDVF